MANKRPSQADLLLAQKYQLFEKIVDASKWPFALLVSWIPLQPIASIMSDLAGKDTTVNIALAGTLSWSVVATSGWAISAKQSTGRKKRLEAARERTDSLEGRLLAEEEVLS